MVGVVGDDGGGWVLLGWSSLSVWSCWLLPFKATWKSWTLGRVFPGVRTVGSNKVGHVVFLFGKKIFYGGGRQTAPNIPFRCFDCLRTYHTLGETEQESGIATYSLSLTPQDEDGFW